jgi:hypothetical protein
MLNGAATTGVFFFARGESAMNICFRGLAPKEIGF